MVNDDLEQTIYERIVRNSKNLRNGDGADIRMISSHLADMGEVLVAIGRRTVTHAECDRKHSELVKRMDGKCMIKGGIAAGISTPIAGLVYFVGKAWGWW